MKINYKGQTIETEEYVEKWSQWALDDTRLPDENIIENVKSIYRECDFAEPKEVIVFDSWTKFIEKFEELKKIVPDLTRTAAVSSYFWADSLSYSDVGLDLLGEDAGELANQKPEIDKWFKLLMGLSFMAFLDELAIVLIKPELKLEPDEELGNDKGKAVVWPDGSGHYFLSGYHMEEEMHHMIVSGKMTFMEILAIENADIRAVALERNKEAILREGADLLHADDRNNELYRVRNDKLKALYNIDELYFVRMLDPTSTPENTRYHIEAIDPVRAKELEYNATACQAELCGITIDEYIHGMDFEG